MPKTKAKRKPAASKGLQPKVFKGLNKKRMEQKGGGKRVRFTEDQPTVTVQFLQKPEDMREFNIHTFQEDGRWNFVPCAGTEECPLCDSESDRVSAVHYRFACNVYNVKNKTVQVLEGPKTLASAIFYRYQRKPAVFLKRVFDITKFPTQPVTYNFELAEEDPVSTRGLKPIDLDEYLLGEMKNYYGDDLDISPSDLSADDDEDEDEDELEEDELEDEEDEDEDLDDEDDDDLDDEEDEDLEDELEDEEEEEPEPPKRKKAPAKKAAAAKKAPAKRKRS